MPHQCTNCGRGFEDGSQEMLSGCPNCGGNKFQFQPGGADTSSAPEPDAEPPEPPEPPGSNSTVAKTVGKTAATVRDIVGGQDEERPGAGAPEPDDGGTAATSEAEDAAQASARGEVVSPDELPAEPESGPDRVPPTTDEPSASAEAESDDDRPDLSELREELNSQFESVKVVAPGQYELNLMELYDREEYIVALQEDGHYSIQVPETIRE